MADTEALVTELNACAEKLDFEKAFTLIKENREGFARELQGAGIGEALKKTTKDRLLLSFVDGAGFASRSLDEALVRLEKLISFSAGALVLNKTWGLGTVRRLDYFYRRITVDFKTRKGHQFTYDAAIDMLERANDDHILVKRQADPAAFEALLKEKPGDFVKLVLKSYGDMPLTRLEDVCVANGFVKSVNWKAFWDRARVELRADKCVEIPARRAEPIRLKDSVEDYGAKWMTAFVQETDPKLILAGVREFVACGKFKAVDEATKAKVGERLVFAVTAARKVDDALYARLACQVVELGLTQPPAAEMRAYLTERRRYIKAAALLPSREVGSMIRFLAADEEAKARLYKALPEFCYTAVCEVVSSFGSESSCREAVAAQMRLPKAPATLTTLLVGKYEQFRDWAELPPLITLLTHAIALGEGRQGGETLKMQNIVRRLFGSSEWLKKVFTWLTDPAEQALFFERFQASIAWDPATHTKIVVEMTKIVPDLKAHVVKVEKKKEYARVTSPRSYALKKAEYLKLINEDMPENVRKIEFAKGFGDLSENAEYQYAKDEQRQLMQKQTVMQAELEAVKPGDFADATVAEVMPGVTVVVSVPDGEKTYHLLGEWDNDVALGVLSSKARLAQNMLGKKTGDQFELPGVEGAMQFGRIVQIKPLPQDIQEWMKVPAGLQV